ncbi:hypothetical protein QI633_24275 [Nocardioides sp. QY071]|uniref:hypothetical protein n=1 Tax=Nocardioides sp. QY071 TaxID=3044187 RepID=UPI00249A070E|nr:hypothetical protein [Nocardioides sp. QY071]WGY01639.1 hypothetical protein QI633_24275 [Nocardioides sp. QY071]
MSSGCEGIGKGIGAEDGEPGQPGGEQVDEHERDGEGRRTHRHRRDGRDRTSQPPATDCGDDTSHDAQYDDQDRCIGDQHERGQAPIDDQRPHLGLEAGGTSEVARDRASQPFRVLDDERLVELVLGADLGERLRAGVPPGEQLGRVAGRDRDAREDGKRGDQQGEDQADHAPEDQDRDAHAVLETLCGTCFLPRRGARHT